MTQIAHLGRNLAWEVLQNAGAVIGFVLAVQCFQTGNWFLAMVLMVVGAFITAVIIAVTESRKSPGHREPVQAILTNFTIMTVLGLILAAVISATTWQLSFIAGALGGFALALAQAAANLTTEKHSITHRFQPQFVIPALRHGVALAIGSGITLLLLNLLLMLQWPVWANAIVVLGVLSPIIVVIDYPVKPANSNNA